VIYLTGIETASNTDLLNNTRLSSIPYSGGSITIQMQANLANATNQFTSTIQLPDGSVPVDTQVIPCGQPVEEVLGGVLMEMYLTQWTFRAPQGGHFTIAVTETGAAILTWRIVLSP
jgi:hypothetical protein